MPEITFLSDFGMLESNHSGVVKMFRVFDCCQQDAEYPHCETALATREQDCRSLTPCFLAARFGFHGIAAMQPFDVGREADGLQLHPGVDRDPLEILAA